MTPYPFWLKVHIGLLRMPRPFAWGSILAAYNVGRTSKRQAGQTAESNIANLLEVFCLELLTPNPPFTHIMDFRGFYSSIILISRGGISRPACWEFPGKFESRSQAMLAGTMLVSRLGVCGSGFQIGQGEWEDLKN